MSAEFFSTVHTSLTALLTLQRDNRNLKDGLIVLKQLLQEGEETADKAELSAVSSAVIVGIRVLADGAIRSQTYKALAEHFAFILDIVFKFSDIQISLKWTEHVKPVLAILLSDTSGSNYTVQIVISSIYGLLQHIFKNSILIKELFSPSSTPLIGKLVTVCIEIITNETRSVESRQIAVDILNLLVSQKEAINTISLIIPGLTSKLTAFLCSGRNSTEYILEKTVQAVFLSAIICLEDGTFIGEDTEKLENNLEVQRTLRWAQLTSERLIPLITNLFARLSIHRSERVKLELLENAQILHTKCNKAFQNGLESAFIDLLLVYLVDQSIRVSAAASRILDEIKSPRAIAYLNEKLVELTTKLPDLVRSKGNGSMAIKQCVAIVEALKENISWMALTRSPVLINFIRSVSNILRFEHKKIFFTTENSKTVKGVISTLPLAFEVEIGNIARLCEVLADKGGVEMIDILIDEIRDCCTSDKTALLVLGSLIIENITVEMDSLPVISIAEVCCDELENILPELIPKDQTIEDLSEDPNPQTMLNIGLISCLTAAIKKLSASSNKIILRSIYRLLQFCSSNNWVLATIADISIKDLAENKSQDVSVFLLEHNSYLLSSVTLACRSFFAFSNAPLAFGAFLDRTNDASTFEVVYHQIMSLLQALDFHKQKNTWVVLRAIKAFLVAMNRWHPEIKKEVKQVVNEEEEEPEMIPKEVTTVEQILQRTKHLLSSDAFPVRMMVMEIQKEAFWFIRNFENQLLPMIHQNWTALVARLEDSNVASRKASFLVMVEMAKVSKSFIHRRVLTEAWPRVAAFLEKNLQRKGALPQNSAFRYCEAVITNAPELFTSIEINNEEWEKILPIFAHFIEDNIHHTLKNASLASISRISRYIEESQAK